MVRGLPSRRRPGGSRRDAGHHADYRRHGAGQQRGSPPHRAAREHAGPAAEHDRLAEGRPHGHGQGLQVDDSVPELVQGGRPGPRPLHRRHLEPHRAAGVLPRTGEGPPAHEQARAGEERGNRQPHLRHRPRVDMGAPHRGRQGPAGHRQGRPHAHHLHRQEGREGRHPLPRAEGRAREADGRGGRG